jgi:repressor LexA
MKRQMKARKTKTTSRQMDILRYIRDYTAAKEYPPTLREIREDLGLSSTSVVSYNLKRLASHGWIEMTPRAARGIRLLEKKSA